MSTQDDQWLLVEEAAQRLNLTTRAAHRYGELGRIKTKRAGRRTLFYVPDVDQLATELGVANRPPPGPPPLRQEMIPAGQMLAYLREKDGQLAQQQQQIAALLVRLAEAQQELGRRILPADEQHLRSELASVTAERDELQRQLAALRPWYRRWYIWALLALVLALALAVAITIVLLK